MYGITRPRLVIAALLAVALSATAIAPAHAETEQVPFKRKDFQRRGPDRRPYIALARDRGELRALWDDFNQRGGPPRIGFGRNIAIVVAGFGSSSCAPRVHDARLNRENKVLSIRMYHYDPPPGYACTDDIAPVTYTLALARADLKPLEPRQLTVRRRFIEDPNS